MKIYAANICLFPLFSTIYGGGKRCGHKHRIKGCLYLKKKGMVVCPA